MKPDELVSLGNVRRYYGDLTELLVSIDHVGIKVPLAYYCQEEDRNILWDGHRRLLCVKLINLIVDLRAEHPEFTATDLLPHLKLQNATVDLFTLNKIGLRGKIEDIPVVKLAPPKGSRQAIEFQLICAAEGLREPLSPIEEASAMNDLFALGKTGVEIATLLGKSEAYVSRRSRLTTLHPDFKQAIDAGDLSVRAAEELLTLDDDSDERLRRSLIGASTQRRVRMKILAANAARQATLQPALTMEKEMETDDPLTLLEREEARLAVAEACKALTQAAMLYQKTDVKPNIGNLIAAAQWLGEESER